MKSVCLENKISTDRCRKARDRQKISKQDAELSLSKRGKIGQAAPENGVLGQIHQVVKNYGSRKRRTYWDEYRIFLRTEQAFPLLLVTRPINWGDPQRNL